MTQQILARFTEAWVPVSEIGIVWPDAQRPVRTSWVDHIADHFDPDSFGTVALAEKNGSGFYHPIDGQHRVKALVKMGYDDQTVPARIYAVHGAAEAAALFRKLNATKKVSRLEDFKVAVTEKRPDEVAVNELVSALGYRVTSGSAIGAIASVSALMSIFHRYGLKPLGMALETIRDTWKSDHDSVRSEMIQAYGELFGAHNREVNRTRLVTQMHKEWPRAGELLSVATTDARMHRTTKPDAVLKLVAHCYNTGLRNRDARITLD